MLLRRGGTVCFSALSTCQQTNASRAQRYRYRDFLRCAFELRFAKNTPQRDQKMTYERRNWPAVSLDETYRLLTAPGAPFEMETIDVAGRPYRLYKKAHRDLRGIFEASKAWGDRTFLVFENERLTFAEHYRATSALAWRLVDSYGVKKGDRVAIAMRNYPEWPIAFWAATTIGAIAVPLNAWGTGDDLAYGLRDSDASVAIVDGERLARLKSLAPGSHSAKLIAVRTASDIRNGTDTLEDLIGPASNYRALPDRAPPDRNIHPDDDATILYTSGHDRPPQGSAGHPSKHHV